MIPHPPLCCLKERAQTCFLLNCTLFGLACPYWLALLPSLGCASCCQTSNQTGNKVQRKTDKQSKNSKEGAIKCSKEISSPTLKYEWGRDTGNDFFVPQFSGGSVTFPGTRNVGYSFRDETFPKTKISSF